MARLIANGMQTFLDNNGDPLAGGFVFMYEPDTSTPKTTWRDHEETDPNEHPIELDAAGRAIIFGNGEYRQLVKDLDGVTIWDEFTSTVDANTGAGLIFAGEAQGTPNNIILVSDPVETDVIGKIVYFYATDTNTGQVFVVVNGNDPVELVKDLLEGPSSLIGGEVTENNLIMMVYDDLDGMYHLVNGVPNDLTLRRIALTRLTWRNSISPTAITGTVHNWNPTDLATTSWVKASASAATTLTGIMAQNSGRTILFQNVGNFPIVLAVGDSGSSPANQFVASDDITVLPGDALIMIQDAAWQLFALGGAASVVPMRGLMITNGGVPGDEMDLTADRLSVVNNDGKAINLFNISLTGDINASGANGLDTGTVAGGGYFIWVIYNPATTTAAMLFSLSSSNPTMPAGFTYKERYGWCRVAGGGNLYRTLQKGNRGKYVISSGNDAPQLAAGSIGDPTIPTYIQYSLTGAIPETAISIIFMLHGPSDARTMAAPNADYANAAATTFIPYSIQDRDSMEYNMMIEEMNVYLVINGDSNPGTEGRVFVTGWVDDVS